MMHHLKIYSELFSAVCIRIKTFEVRKNDRNFQVGDSVCLHECDEEAEETGRHIKFIISYVLAGEGIKKGYVVLGIKSLSELSY